MQYIHNPPSLSELRQMRREAKELMEGKPIPKRGFLSKFTSAEVQSSDDSLQIMLELINHQLDVVVAHLENQNELLLELTRKLDKNSHD